MNRELICNGAFLTVALSLAMAFPTKKSEAQPLGPTPAQMQFQTQVPGYEKAQGATRIAPRSELATRPAMGLQFPKAQGRSVAVGGMLSRCRRSTRAEF